MKIKLTPELAYVIGFWRKRKAFEGLGVRGEPDFIETFSKLVLDMKLAESGKLLTEEKKVYFYHSAYRKFFQDVENDQLERFKYLNEYAANYLAGMFDSSGGISDKGFVYIDKATPQDEILLMRLGFGAKRKEGALIVERPKVFLAFIKNYVKRFAGHEVFGMLGKKKRQSMKATTEAMSTVQPL